MPADDPVRGLCPHCGEPLRGWTVGDVAVDGCDACGGCWFDGGELPAAANLDGDALAAAEQAFAAGLSTLSGGGPGRCPRCGVKLVERTMRQARLAVQACPSCDGMWFDEGRLQALSETLPADRQRRPAKVAPKPVPASRPTARCPHCGELNGVEQTACASCGQSLSDVPAGKPGDTISSHSIDWGVLRSEAQYAFWALVVAFVMWDPPGHGYRSHRYHLNLSPDFGLLLQWAGALLAVWYARWLVKTWRIDVSAGGLMVRRITGRRFIPWSAMRRLVALDLPGRVRPSFFAPRERPYHGHRDLSRATSHIFDGPPRQARTQTPGPGDRFVAEELRGAVLLFTDYGLVTIGPHLTDSGGLYHHVRDRWDE